jgi:CheY-like chemotaxis protein
VLNKDAKHVILLADDSEDDRLLIKRGFQKAGVLNPIREVTTGRQVMAYLNGDTPYDNRVQYPLPAILLLDLSMPDGDGFQVLRWIRNKLVCAPFLIIVLSRLNEIKHINRAYGLGANSFLTKPGSEDELMGLIRAFRDYWILENKAVGPE